MCSSNLKSQGSSVSYLKFITRYVTYKFNNKLRKQAHQKGIDLCFLISSLIFLLLIALNKSALETHVNIFCQMTCEHYSVVSFKHQTI